jgi:hypothetical protein
VKQPRIQMIVVRMVSHTTSTVWPDDYPGMSFAEACAYERNDVNASALLANEGKMSMTITTTEISE